MAGDFLAVLAFMRDKFFATLEQITRPQMSHVQYRAVSLLYRKGSLSMSELAKEMHISKQQLTPLVYKLINNGLVIRKTDEDDRRIVLIEITETGRRKVEEMLPEIKLVLMEKLETLPVAELDELMQMLKRIHEIIKNVE
ncbi:MAG: HTH-type transcriptional regulator MhqR [Pelotomaculum sp. PtaU1.Bin035]|nr:MAG: HTH-type transcriptional regulator MhqR [Pelotomaculum sp. PtaU1.Bin035]